MNHERCDRDRVTAILTLAEAHDALPDVIDPQALSPDQMDTFFAFLRSARSEAPWLARTLLEALDTIDRLEAEKEALVRELYIETGIWRGQALNGGNEP